MADWRTTLEQVKTQLHLQEQEERWKPDILDRLFEGLSKGREVKTLVVHRHPDVDAWLCLWIASKFIQETKGANIVFVNSGETLNGDDQNDLSVLHFDTGGGEYDQHGKGLERSSSAFLLVIRKGLDQIPGILPLLELSIAVDNIDPVPPTSIHYSIEGYAFLLRHEDGSTDWDKVKERVFELFDIVFGQETQRVQSREQLNRYANQIALPNGIHITNILWQPQLREAAFEEGAMVVIWTDSLQRSVATGNVATRAEFNWARKLPTFRKDEWERIFYTGIQRNRRFPQLFLDRVAEELDLAEARKRRVHPHDLPAIWFLHETKTLILNGSRTHEPAREEFTALTPTEIVGIVQRTLSFIPTHITSRWGLAPR